MLVTTSQFFFENNSMEDNSSSWLRCFQWQPNTATEAIAIDYFAEDFDDTAEQEQAPWMNDRCLIRDEEGRNSVGIVVLNMAWPFKG